MGREIYDIINTLHQILRRYFVVCNFVKAGDYLNFQL